MKNREYIPLLVFAGIAVGILIGGFLSFRPQSFADNATRTKLNRLIDFIESEYVDDINTDSIVDLTVNNILAKLDPHSVYIPPAELTYETESMQGDFVGIGVNFYQYNDTVAIIKPTEDGPSAKAGILPGDRILYAGNTRLFGRKWPTDSLYTYLKGEDGSKVKLTVYRKSENRKFAVMVTRAVIPIKSVDAAVMLNEKVGYIKINRFAETTYDEFKAGLQSLLKRGMSELVIDVRDNSGGYMEKAIEIADELLPAQDLIVFTKNRKGRVDRTYATKKGDFEKGKVYVLINENSASAAEILAGAVQDNDRGTIVGRRSFGKGLVQREMDFGDGSAVRLTVARYYTPSGRSIQKPYGGDEDYFGEFGHRFETGELYHKDSIRISDTLQFKTKRGRLVFGGGGIVPDVFVPLEDAHAGEGISYLMQSGVVGHFVFEHLDKNRSAFAGLSFDAFRNKMSKDDSYVADFSRYLSKNGLDLDLSDNRELVKRHLKAEFTRQLFSDEKSYGIVLQGDPMIEQVLKGN